MSELQLLGFINDLGDDAFPVDALEPLERWIEFFSLEGNQFLIPSIRERCTACVRAMVALCNFIGQSFFIYPETRVSRVALYPNLNPDRLGSGDPEEELRYSDASTRLHQLAGDVRQAYRSYRRSVKEQLAL